MKFLTARIVTVRCSSPQISAAPYRRSNACHVYPSIYRPGLPEFVHGRYGSKLQTWDSTGDIPGMTTPCIHTSRPRIWLQNSIRFALVSCHRSLLPLTHYSSSREAAMHLVSCKSSRTGARLMRLGRATCPSSAQETGKTCNHRPTRLGTVYYTLKRDVMT